LHGFGGQILDAAGRPALDSDGAIASVAFVESLAADELLPPESTGVVAAQLFNDGRAALTINGPWFVGEIAPGVPFGVAPLPTVPMPSSPAVRQIWEPLNQALRKVLRGATSARPAMLEAQKRVVEALRPPPPPAPLSPYLALLALVTVAGAAWTLHRARARGGL